MSIRKHQDEGLNRDLPSILAFDVGKVITSYMNVVQLITLAFVCRQTKMLVKKIFTGKDLYVTFLAAGRPCGSGHFRHNCRRGDQCGNNDVVMVHDPNEDWACYCHIRNEIIAGLSFLCDTFIVSILLGEEICPSWSRGYTGTTNRLYFDPINTERVFFWNPYKEGGELDKANAFLKAQLFFKDKKENFMDDKEMLKIMTSDMIVLDRDGVDIVCPAYRDKIVYQCK